MLAGPFQFFRHEKGKQIGISAIAVVVAPFAGGIIGGGIIYNQSLGWRWTQWIASIAIGVGLILQFFFLPETVYIRDGRAIEESKPHSTLGRLSRRMGFRLPKRGDGPRHSFFFVASRPFKMFAYPSVLLASFWFGVAVSLFPLGSGTTMPFKDRSSDVRCSRLLHLLISVHATRRNYW